MKRSAWVGVMAALLVGGCSGSEGDGPQAADGEGADGTSEGTAASDGVADPEVAAPPILCEAGATRCAGGLHLQTCTADGTFWEASVACDEGRICDETTAACITPFCWPGARECEGPASFHICHESGAYWSEQGTCSGDTACFEGACYTCEPGQRECIDETTWRACDEEGSTWSEATPCEPGSACAKGACFACEPGELVCVDEATLAVCDEEGAGIVAADPGCEEATTCINAACHGCQIVESCQSLTQYRRDCDSPNFHWSEVLDCPPQQLCDDGSCIHATCAPAVLLVVDRSGSMSSHWPSVSSSILSLVSKHDQIRFGLVGFPAEGGCDVSGVLDVPWSSGEPELFAEWLDAHPPSGSTPLQFAMELSLNLAEVLFAEFGGHVVVLSDGEDTCADGGDVVYKLGEIAADLLGQWAVHTWVIGYNFDGNPAGLDAMAKYGGTPYDKHISAGDQVELDAAFDAVLGDIKICGSGSVPPGGVDGGGDADASGGDGDAGADASGP